MQSITETKINVLYSDTVKKTAIFFDVSSYDSYSFHSELEELLNRHLVNAQPNSLAKFLG